MKPRRAFRTAAREAVLRNRPPTQADSTTLMAPHPAARDDNARGPARATGREERRPAWRGHRIMDGVLERYPLYDLQGATNSFDLDRIKSLFKRYRAVRGKTTDLGDVASLNRSWTAFIDRWNRDRDAFLEWIEHREGIVDGWSLSVLRKRICELAWVRQGDEYGRLCWIEIREGCRVCGS